MFRDRFAPIDISTATSWGMIWLRNMSALPKLEWGGDRRVKVVNPTLTSGLRYRAGRASVDRDTIIEGRRGVRLGRRRVNRPHLSWRSVKCPIAFKGIFAVSRSEKRGQDRRRATERP